MSEETAVESKNEPTGTRVKWKVDNLKSSYVNFANANSTREEVVMNFGLNTSWDRSQQEVEIELEHRIVLSPFAAKRLAELLNLKTAVEEMKFAGKSGRLRDQR